MPGFFPSSFWSSWTQVIVLLIRSQTASKPALYDVQVCTYELAFFFGLNERAAVTVLHCTFGRDASVVRSSVCSDFRWSCVMLRCTVSVAASSGSDRDCIGAEYELLS